MEGEEVSDEWNNHVSHGVLVQPAKTNYHRLDCLNKYETFLTFLEDRKSKINEQAGLASGENLILGLQIKALSLYPHM